MSAIGAKSPGLGAGTRAGAGAETGVADMRSRKLVTTVVIMIMAVWIFILEAELRGLV